ncbi:hypothetical protein IB69_018055 [Xanthomonas citri]|nr:hypothetical protein TP50_12935 [Xanthomonas citri pv. aurantifolii]OQP71052.1 hypothetical protein IB69_018055 [Xanthomonas citri]
MRGDELRRAAVELIPDLRGRVSASLGQLFGVLVDDRLESELGGQECLPAASVVAFSIMSVKNEATGSFWDECDGGWK